MKRKYILFILIIVICACFLTGCNYISRLRTNKEGTSLEDEIEVKEDTIEFEQEEMEEPKITNATILATGDIMFHMPQTRAAFNSGSKTYNFEDNFKYVKKHIESADLAVANFETVIAGEGIEYSGFPNFNSPIDTLSAIKDAGFHILTTANNHCLDQGKKGLINTIDAIEEKGMKNIGTYKVPNTPIMVEEINEIKLGLLSYTYGFNGMEYTLTEEERKYMISEINEDKIKKDIEKAKALDVDIVAVFIHWGNEYHQEPSDEQKQLGKKMVEWGANIIFGSHPHVIQKSEIINYGGMDNFIIYSMGNFLSNQRKESMNNKYTEDGIMVKIELEKDFIKGKTIIKNIDYIPTWVRRYKASNRLKYEILPIQEFLEDETLFNSLREMEQIRLKESFQSTIEKMIKY